MTAVLISLTKTKIETNILDWTLPGGRKRQLRKAIRIALLKRSPTHRINSQFAAVILETSRNEQVTSRAFQIYQIFRNRSVNNGVKTTSGLLPPHWKMTEMPYWKTAEIDDKDLMQSKSVEKRRRWHWKSPGKTTSGLRPPSCEMAEMHIRGSGHSKQIKFFKIDQWTTKLKLLPVYRRHIGKLLKSMSRTSGSPNQSRNDVVDT